MSQTDLFGEKPAKKAPPPKAGKGSKKPARAAMHTLTLAARKKAGNLGVVAAEGCDTAVDLAKLIFDFTEDYHISENKWPSARHMRPIVEHFARKATRSIDYGTETNPRTLATCVYSFAKFAEAGGAWDEVENAALHLLNQKKQTRLPVSFLPKLANYARWLTQGGAVGAKAFFAPAPTPTGSPDEYMARSLHRTATKIAAEATLPALKEVAQHTLDELETFVPIAGGY